jgi:branched-chain amino acid transport system ATP-binding protein
MLSIERAHAGYSGEPVIRDITISVKRGAIVSIIGANGAGKTTTLKSLVGVVPLMKGRVALEAQSIDAPNPTRLLAAGVAMVPEGRGVLSGLTVRENLLIGGYTVRGRKAVQERLEEAFGLFPRLRERSQISAGLLSGGEQQMLAIGRALMSRPTFLLLDEPSMGLSPLLVQFVADLLERLATSGIGILLAEQNAQMALSIAHWGYVLEQGVVALSGSGSDLRSNDAVRTAYLGMEVEA